MNLTVKTTFAALLMTAGMIGSAQADQPTDGYSTLADWTRQISRVMERPVQSQPAYSLSRPEVVSGTRMTVFAGFLEHQTGAVLLEVGGTVAQCRIVDWRTNSVTFYLPMLGMAGGRDATLRVVKPSGRIAKTLDVRLVPQPEIVIHGETVGQPGPAAGYVGLPSYAAH
ncbi:hypothetical protein [Stieleria mannarensis]|uniref:hypothetical protein n=1 Tax=Stieleria mannarensis TaxID=2755585 RepID=UPI001603AE1D|nr:hypothetical protein [Rhodopirellula sp. JC639]